MVQVTVTVDEQHLGSIAAVAAALRQQGMEVDSVLESLGVITGSLANDRQTSTVAAVEGVESVDQSVQFRVPPPDSPVQ